MSGASIQIAAKGQTNIYLSGKPEITFFKAVYKRHTNFSIECIPQYFSTIPNFGTKVSCTLSNIGDMISRGYLLVELPSIPRFYNSKNNLDEYIRVAWAKNIGYRLIKNIVLDIGNKVIDTQYGEWLYIWSQLNVTGNQIGHDKMTGFDEKLYSFTKTKDSYQLFIPLQFWFCKSYGLALPLISLKYSDVRINIEFSSLDECLTTGPTHRLKIDDNIVPYNEGDILIQKGKDRDIIGIFIDYDFINRELLYLKVQDEFTGKPLNGILNKIKNLLSDFEVTPTNGNISETYVINFTTEINIKSAYLLFDYVLLDNEERSQFYNNKLTYIIEQLQFNGEKTINNSSYSCNLNFFNPVKSIYWIAQFANYESSKLNAWNYYKAHLSMEYLRFNKFRLNQKLVDPLCITSKTNDPCNIYKTDSSRSNWNQVDYIAIKNLIKFKDLSDYFSDEKQFIIKNAKILLNGQEKVQEYPYQYFTYLQNYKYDKRSLDNHIFSYNFGLRTDLDPRGSMNFSKIDQATLNLKLAQHVSYFNPVKFRLYAVNYNILIIEEGIGELQFKN
jgi:hypothetical protein